VKLGRWLRVAGYDAAIAAPASSDEAILASAMEEHRILLTRDRHFQTMASPPGQIIFLKGTSLKEWARQLKDEIHLDWLFHPFSRCLVCNEVFVPADREMVESHVPEKSRSLSTSFWVCKTCNKVYWQGTHTERMLKQLQDWKSD
jgi:uncharacterized protein